MKLKITTLILLSVSYMYAQNALTPGNIQINPTFEHIGILYNISGDANLNSDLQIEFREQGNGAYQNGAVTMRSHSGLVVDGSTFNVNHHAGSAMFLQPNTTYDIRLTLTDPDGGGTTTTIQASTKAYPVESTNYQYVAPGNGGGNGTSANPYLGLQAAADNAQPGITFIVRPGTYTPFNVATNGTANAPITFRSETLHAAIVDGGNTSSGVIVLGDFTTDSLQHIIIDGFKIQNGNYGIDAQHTQFITIKNCWIENVVWGFYNRRENAWEHDQYITNNYIDGRTDWTNGGTSHRGIDIRGNRNVISFNTIKNFDDGVSTDGAPYAVSYAMDIHNNDIQNMADDLIEVDGVVSNTRIYRNRMYNARAGVSLAPVFGGPCYVLRNEMYNMADGFSAYKMNRSPAGLVIVHNSSAKIGNGMSSPTGWQNTFFKNNVVMGTRYCFEEYELVSDNDDWDYNAYYSPRPGNNVLGEQWFKWDNVRYGDLNELQTGTNIETNGIEFDQNTDIVDVAFPATDDTEYTPDDTDFQPTSGSNFRNNGINLDNLNDGFVSDGMPDRGAYEYGNPLPQYGAEFTLPQPDDGVSAGVIRVDATFEHIGILYNISGDGNLNSSLQIEFKEQGTFTYKNGAITMRSHPALVIDGSTYNANHHAGSAMFLRPNTTYDIRLTLIDPDGGGTTTTIQASTKAYPVESTNYQYVAPGNGGGNGTSANPYLGLQTAANNAQPGMTFIVRPGNYTPFNVATDGTANAPITLRSETPHAAIIDGGNTSGGVIILGDFTTDSLQHIIIDGLKIQNGNIGIDAQHTQFITIKNCWIEDVVWGFYNRRENGWEHDQYLTNNYIKGRADWLNGGTSHRGIDIRGNRNVVSFNTIKNFDDGVSTDGPPYALSYAMDIHNNDIQNMADDLVEVDGTVSNTRVYRNRIYNGRAGVSLAPVFGGPCYVFRNEMYNMQEGYSTYKMNRGPSGLVIVHNSSSKIGNGMSSPAGWQNTFFKNNIVMGTRYCFEEFGLVDGSIDDWDYNGYFSTRPGTSTPGEEWFKWNNVRYGTLSDLQTGTDIETNGMETGLNADVINAPPPADDGIEYTYDDTKFQLYNASDFRNSGVQLDNINDGFVFDGMPDLGAYDFGNTLPQYGVDFGCKIALPLSIDLQIDQIILTPYYNYYDDLLFIKGLRREYTIEVADENGNEIPSFIDGENRIVIASCPYINSKYYLVITHNTQPDVKAEIWLNE